MSGSCAPDTGQVPQDARVYRFERLQPGAEIGRCIATIDAEALALWHAIYGTAPGLEVPSGFAAVLVMRAYLGIVSPRPPGNIHRALTVRVEAPMSAGQQLSMAVTCLSKTLRNERRYVLFEVSGHDASSGRLALAGQVDMLWAA